MELIILTLLTCTTAMRAVVTARHVRPINSTVSRSQDFLEVVKSYSLRPSNNTSAPQLQLQTGPPLDKSGAENQTYQENQAEVQQLKLPGSEPRIATSSFIPNVSSIDDPQLIREPSEAAAMDPWYQKMSSGVPLYQPYYPHLERPTEFREPSLTQPEPYSARYWHLLPDEAPFVGSRSGLHQEDLREEAQQRLINEELLDAISGPLQKSIPVQAPYVQPRLGVPSVPNNAFVYQKSPVVPAKWRNGEAPWVTSNRNMEDILANMRNLPRPIETSWMANRGYPYSEDTGEWRFGEKEAPLVPSSTQFQQRGTPDAFKLQPNIGVPFVTNRGYSYQGSSAEPLEWLRQKEAQLVSSSAQLPQKPTLETLELQPHKETLIEANKGNSNQESPLEGARSLQSGTDTMATSSSYSQQQIPLEASKLQPLLEALVANKTIFHEESLNETVQWLKRIEALLVEKGDTSVQQSKLQAPKSTDPETPSVTTKDQLTTDKPTEVPILQAPKKRSESTMKRLERLATPPASDKLDETQFLASKDFPHLGSIGDKTDLLSETPLERPPQILNQGILEETLTQLSDLPISASRGIPNQGSSAQILSSPETLLVTTKDQLPLENPTEAPILQALKKRSEAAMKRLQRLAQAQTLHRIDKAPFFAGMSLPDQGSIADLTDLFSKAPLEWPPPQILNQGILAEPSPPSFSEQPSPTNISFLSQESPGMISQLQVLKEGSPIANNISRERVSSIEAPPLLPRADVSLVPSRTQSQQSPTEAPVQLHGEPPFVGMRSSLLQESPQYPQESQLQNEAPKVAMVDQPLPNVLSESLQPESHGQTASVSSQVDSKPPTPSDKPQMKRANVQPPAVTTRNSKSKNATETTSQRLNDTRAANATRRQSTTRNTTELPQVLIVSEDQARELIEGFNDISRSLASRSSAVAWAFESDMSEENRKKMQTEKKAIAQKNQQIWKALMRVDWKQFKDPDLRRRYFMSSILGTTALSSNESVEYTRTIRAMKEMYSKATVCYYTDRTNCTLHLNPDLEEILARSRNESELRYYWKAWRDASGRQMRKNYERYADMKRAISKANGILDPVKMWNFYFEDPDFEQRVQDLWDEIKPMYDQLHAYARHKLFEFYGPDVMTKDGPIPAHLFGNMWGQSWVNVKDIMMKDPFFEGYKGDIVTEELQKQGFNIIQIAKEAEKFFVSLGFPKLPEPFWTKSIFTRPPGIDLNCHPSSWNFYNNDVRVKMCSSVDEKNFITVHHEMGHCEYYLMYAHQPFVFQKGANQGFHEAIGDTVALNVQTPTHMEKIGLVNKTHQNVRREVRNIAHLLHIALEKISFIPFGYLIDKYRWEVMHGNITSDRLNEAYWEMREKYQGLEPPVPRSEEDFDPGAKFHVAADSKYIIYFVSHILQFQLYKGLCQAAGQYDPSNQNVWLSECDVFGNQAAGEKFRAMMSLGASKPWPDALEIVTGTRELSERPFLEYFKPLYKWLKEYNSKNNIIVGWNHKSNVMMPSKLPPN